MGNDYVWFITGTSSGFGKAVVLEALQRGHKVIATARNSAKLDELKAAGAAVMDVDVTADEDTLAAKLAEANAIYGKITHVVNAAGYPLQGAVEEASNKEVFDQYNTNVFGTCNIARAVTPHLRETAKYRTDGNVALATFGSVGSWISGPAVAHYCSTKWAVSGLTEGLAEELAPFGIDVCAIEPGYVRTNFLEKEGGETTTKRQLAVYDGTPVVEWRKLMHDYNGQQPGDVVKCARVIVDVLTGEGVAKGKKVPIRLVLGDDCLQAIRDKIARTLKLLDEWEEVSTSTMRDEYWAGKEQSS